MSSKPVHISLAEATQKPCELVTLGQATAILGTSVATGDVDASNATVVAGSYSSCIYSNDATLVTVSLNFGALGEGFSASEMKNPAPAIFAGHAGVCGPDTTKEQAVNGPVQGFELSAPFVIAPAPNAVWLSVDGAPACAVDAKFAEAVYANV